MKRLAKRCLTGLLTTLLVLGLLPATAFAAGMEAGLAPITLNKTNVNFGGYEWWVIGDPDGGVLSENNQLTLFIHDGARYFEGTPYRYGGIEPFEPHDENMTIYNGLYYDNNPSGMAPWKTPNEYTGSTLQQLFEKTAEELPSKERDLINPRDLEATDFQGPDCPNQFMWPLSSKEYEAINSDDVYWCVTGNQYISLRNSYANVYVLTACVTFELDVSTYSNYAHPNPGMYLDTTRVLFTSDANETSGKSTAVIGGGFVPTTATDRTGTVKYTVLDTNRVLRVSGPVATVDGDLQPALGFSYMESGLGAYFDCLSCVLSDVEGNVCYYSKVSDNVFSNYVEIAFDGVADGRYQLSLFTEQLNDDTHTDFCTQPYTTWITVTDGMVEADDLMRISVVCNADTWQKGSGSDLDFTINTESSSVQQILVDGNALDLAHFKQEGNTVITLLASYLESLTPGDHTLVIVTDAGTAECTFTVAETAATPTTTPATTVTPASTTTTTSSAPQTGTTEASPAAALCLLAAGLGLTGVLILRRRRA